MIRNFKILKSIFKNCKDKIILLSTNFIRDCNDNYYFNDKLSYKIKFIKKYFFEKTKNELSNKPINELINSIKYVETNDKMSETEKNIVNIVNKKNLKFLKYIFVKFNCDYIKLDNFSSANLFKFVINSNENNESYEKKYKYICNRQNFKNSLIKKIILNRQSVQLMFAEKIQEKFKPHQKYKKNVINRLARQFLYQIDE